VLNAFFFGGRRPKEKSFAKKKGRFCGAMRPTPAPPFEKGGRKLYVRSAPSFFTSKNILAGAEILREFLQKRGKCDILNPNGREGSL
jgi:hypothetical protein